jgi:peptidoglycan/xylan/chitin deacetylase (PgdA/CDA1 family)
MIRLRPVLIGLTAIVCASLVCLGAEPGTAQRRVAVTIDDLPLVQLPGNQRCDSESARAAVGKFVDVLSRQKVPATGFVAAGTFCDLEDTTLLVSLLEAWADAGVELGNHTYSHVDLNHTPFNAYTKEIVRGETPIRKLMKRRGKKLRYFRHPLLHTGGDPVTKEAVERFVTQRGYWVAPVTLDNQDYVFASAYRRALERNDEEAKKKIVAGYMGHMMEVFEFYEQLSRDLFGYEFPQILLLHASALNADHLEELIELIRARGYSFVTLEEALDDPTYDSPDAYVGSRGLSWLHRWAFTRGDPIRPEPREPEWVREMTR